VLSRNFRSHTEILDAAAQCVANNPRRVSKALVAVRGHGGRVQVRGFGSDWQEAHWTAGRIGQAIAAGTPGPEILVLARTGYATQPVQTALARAGIPHRVLGSLGLYERAEVKDALAYLTLLVNPADGQAFRRAVQSPRRGVGAATIALVLVVTRAREKHEGDVISACLGAGAIDELRNRAVRERLVKFGSALARIREEMRSGR
jgi:DNA helicase II / ATP-dependent DNA helicase PcrA